MRLSKIALVIGILVGLSLQAPVITFCTIYDEH